MSELNRIKKEFEVYGKTLHNVIHDNGIAADYIDELESQLEKYKQAAEYGLELASFYGDKDNYRVDKNHVKNVYFTEEIIGNEGRDLGKFARELKPKIEELLRW